MTALRSAALVVVLVVAAALAYLALASGGGDNEPSSAAAVDVATATAAQATTAPAIPTSRPEQTSPPATTPEPASSLLPDRTDCAAISGTEYMSETERVWFMQNCQPAPRPTPGNQGAFTQTVQPSAPASTQPAATDTPPATPTRVPGPSLQVAWLQLISQPPTVCNETAPVPPNSGLNGVCMRITIAGITDGSHQLGIDLLICNFGAFNRTFPVTAAGGAINYTLGIGKAAPGEPPLTQCPIRVTVTLDGANLGTRTVNLP